LTDFRIAPQGVAQAIARTNATSGSGYLKEYALSVKYFNFHVIFVVLKDPQQEEKPWHRQSW